MISINEKKKLKKKLEYQNKWKHITTEWMCPPALPKHLCWGPYLQGENI